MSEENPYRCEHEDSEVRRRRIGLDGRVVHWRQCKRCGHGVRAVRVSGFQEYPEWDEGLKERWDREREAWYAARRKNWEEDRVREKAEFWDWYSDYLQTDDWREKRRLVLERAKGVCEGCGERRPVQAHHLTYDRVGEEMLFDLVAVCRECHERLHPHLAPNIIGKIGRYAG